MEQTIENTENIEEIPKVKRKRKKGAKKPGPKPKKKSRYKRKIGRKKKPGPKPKPKPKPKKVRPTLKYRLILTVNNRKKNIIERFHSEEDAYKMMHELYKQNQEEIIFPVQNAHYGGVMREVKYNLFIIRKVTEDDIETTTKLRNSYGEFVNYDTDHFKWMIVDKCEWQIEETFWVFGYHPQYQRKDFKWIFTNFLEKNADDKYMFKNVWLFHNKVIIECMEHLEIIFCKTKSDGIRLYNKLEEWCTQHKFKYVVFCGRIEGRGVVGKWVERLCEWTGFDKIKMSRPNLRP